MKLTQVQKSDAIINYLKQNELINLNIIGKIENNTELPIFTDDSESPSGVLVKSGYMHFLYTESDDFINAVIDQHMKEGFFGFAGIDKSLSEKIKRTQTVHWCNPCSIYAYTSDTAEPVPGDYDLRPIALEDAKIVDAFYEYRNDNSLSDIQKDIKLRPSSAVYVDDEPVCWVLVHEDNSMGIMYTKEEHRRKGLAEVVSRDLTRRILENNQTPYLQIVDGNVKSHGLAQKCGFEKVGDCEWFGIITGNPKEIRDDGEKMLKLFESAYKRPLFSPEVGQTEVNYFMMFWKKDTPDQGYKVRVLNPDKDSESLEKWANILRSRSGVSKPSADMEAWVIEHSGDIVGAALMKKNGEEDHFMFDFAVVHDDHADLSMNALVEEVQKAKSYFICTLVPASEIGSYERFNFRSCGMLDI